MSKPNSQRDGKTFEAAQPCPGSAPATALGKEARQTHSPPKIAICANFLTLCDLTSTDALPCSYSLADYSGASRFPEHD
jgi:hypothetical protein